MTALIIRSRLAFVGLACILLNALIFEFTDFNAMQIHVIMCFMVCPLFASKDLQIKLLVFFYTILQYIMIFDIYKLLVANDMNYNILSLDSSITSMYIAYPYIDFTINILIILSIIKAGKVNHGSAVYNNRNSAPCGLSFSYSQTHKSR